MWPIIIEIVVTCLGIIAGGIQSDTQLKGSEERAAKETKVRKVFDAAINRFGITMSQIDSALNKLGIRRSDLENESRGSARLSTASKIYREFIEQYPERVKQMENVRNSIQNEINNLQSKEATYASKIQQRQGVSTQQVTNDIVNSVNNINTQLSTLGPSDRTEQIDTSIVPGGEFKLESPGEEFMNQVNSNSPKEQFKQYVYGKKGEH